MYKLLSSLLAFALLISLVSCSSKPTDDINFDTQSNATQATASEDSMLTQQSPQADTRYRATREEKADGFKYKNVNILALGDSITAGDGSPSGYRYQLYEYLYTNDARFSMVGPNKSTADTRLPERYQYHGGVGGRKIQDLTDNIDTLCNYDYDIVLLMIGTNDSNELNGILDRYRTMLKSLIAKNPDASIYVSEPIPRRGESKESTSHLMFNAKLPDLCKEFADNGSKVTFVDMKFDTWDDTCYNDAVHPNEKGNAIIGKAFGDAVLDEILQINDSGDESYVEPVRVSGIEIQSSTLSLEVGLAKTVKATVFPADAEAFTVLWSSSNTDIATVSDHGKITAHKEGTATIVAKSIDGGFEKSCEVTVKKSDEPIGQSVFSTAFNNKTDWAGNTERISDSGFTTDWGTSGNTVKITSTASINAGSNYKIAFDYQSSGNASQSQNVRAGYSSVSYKGFEVRINNSATYIDLYADGKLAGEYYNGGVNQNKLKIVFKYLNGKATVTLDGELIISADISAPQNTTENITATIGDHYRICSFTSLKIDKY